MDWEPATSEGGRERAAAEGAGALVTVVVPTRNRAGVLADAVRSALAQTHTELEVVIVDDGSTDGTPDVCAALAVADRRVRVVRERCGGPSAARNRGLAVARGGWILFLDDDDLLEPDCVGTLLGAAEGAGCEAAACRGRLFTAGLEPVSVADLRADPARFNARPVDLEPPPAWVSTGVLLQRNPFPIHGALVAVARLLEVGGFDPGLGCAEDLDCWLRLVGRIGRFPLLDAPLTWYREHPAQRSREVRMRGRATADVLERALARRPELRHGSAVRRRLAHLRREEAYGALLAGDGPGARRAAWRSIRLRPTRVKSWLYLLASVGPGAYGWARRVTGTGG